jgi:DNA-binding IclR family transcriptional regulator
LQNNVTNPNRNQLIASAAGTLEILEILGNAQDALPFGAIVAASGRPKATVHRMLATLVNTGYATHEQATGRYRLTLKSWRLGAAAVRDLDVTGVAHPALERLMRETGETVHLTVLDPSGDVIYVSKVESPQSIRVQTRLGQLNPSWCTATGRCLLAFNEKVADQVLARKLPARTPRTVTDPRKLRALLGDVRDGGYAVTRAENHPEMGGVAAPIRDHTGSVGAACGVAIPVFRMDRELVDRIIPLVIRAASDISDALGFAATKRSIHAA